MEIILYACSCNCFRIDVPLQDIGLNLVAFKAPKTKTIFIGKFVDYKTVDSDFVLTFEVEQTYKGETAPTIEIRTSTGDCGFRATKGATCLISAYEGKNNQLYTASSECCRSVSKDDELKKYVQYKTFLDVVTQKINGKHTFERFPNEIYSCKRPTKKTVDPIF